MSSRGQAQFPAELAYIAEIHWLKEHGLISSWWEYSDLPLPVLEDCRLLMEADEKRAEMEAHNATQRR